MTKYFLSFLLTLSLALPVLAQETSAVVPPPTITINRAQVTGINDNIISVSHIERGRRVYDPVTVTDETTIWLGKKQVGLKNIRLKQILGIVATQQGNEFIAQKIEIGGIKKIIPKKVVKKTLRTAIKPKTTNAK